MSVTLDSIREAAKGLEQETVETRRDFHRHPEIAFEEVRTSGIVAERLEALGLEVRRNVGQTGVVGVLETGKPGRTVLARADMDALPVFEERDSAYRSTVDGKMHACGHDGHTAVLLSVAKLLTERKDELTEKSSLSSSPPRKKWAARKRCLKTALWTTSRRTPASACT